MAEFYWDHVHKDIDKSEFTDLVLNLQKGGSSQDPRLGVAFMAIITKLLWTEEFRSVTQDWKIDLAGETMVALFGIVKKYDGSKGDAFTYTYSCALYKMRKQLKKLKRLYEWEEVVKEVGISQAEFLAKKKKLLKSESNENIKKKMESLKGSLRPVANLPKAVGLAIRNTIKSIDGECIKILLDEAKNAKGK